MRRTVGRPRRRRNDRSTAASPHARCGHPGRSAEVIAWIGDQLRRAVDGAGDGILGVIGAAVAAGDLEFTEGLVIMHTLLSAGGESTTSLLGSAIHMLALEPALQARLLRRRSSLRPSSRKRCGSNRRSATTCATPAGRPKCTACPSRPGRPCCSFGVLPTGTRPSTTGPTRWCSIDPLRDTTSRSDAESTFASARRLARLETEVVLTRLLARTDHFALDPDHPPTRVNSLMVRRFVALPLVATASRDT